MGYDLLKCVAQRPTHIIVTGTLTRNIFHFSSGSTLIHKILGIEMTRGAMEHAQNDRSWRAQPGQSRAGAGGGTIHKIRLHPIQKYALKFSHLNSGVLCVRVCIQNCDRSCVFIRSVQSVRVIGSRCTFVY